MWVGSYFLFSEIDRELSNFVQCKWNTQWHFTNDEVVVRYVESKTIKALKLVVHISRFIYLYYNLKHKWKKANITLSALHWLPMDAQWVPPSDPNSKPPPPPRPPARPLQSFHFLKERLPFNVHVICVVNTCVCNLRDVHAWDFVVL